VGGSDGCLKGHLTAFFPPVTIMDAIIQTPIGIVCVSYNPTSKESEQSW